jgi:AcrR family transcriptional regulator
MGRREDNKLKTRQAILETALRLFHERGFDETRVQDIIEPVGISEKTFFNYFAGKQAILDASADDVLAAYEVLLDYELENPERPFVDRLGEIVDLWAQNFAVDKEFLATVATRTTVFFGASGTMRERHRATQGLLAELFHQGQQRGEVQPAHDPSQLAEVLTATMLLTTINWLEGWRNDSDEPLDARLRRAVEIFLEGALSRRPKESARKRPGSKTTRTSSSGPDGASPS